MSQLVWNGFVELLRSLVRIVVNCNQVLCASNETLGDVVGIGVNVLFVGVSQTTVLICSLGKILADNC
jgi:hypothetical protein